METMLNNALETVNGLLWNYVVIALLVLSGIWFTIRTRFVQIKWLPEMVRLLGEGVGTSTKGNHISSFQAFCISTASRVGVGNIAGIAIAIVLGGPGAIFWMWFIALLGASTGFIESTLAQIYKEPLKGGGFHGGPAYYIKNGMNSPIWATVFAFLISVTYGLIFNSVQANTIAASLDIFDIGTVSTGIVLAIASGIIIFGGASRIAKVTEWIVPIMAGLYILTAVFITVVNIRELPHVFELIFSNAFNMTSATGGFMGAAMTNGIKRGLFSNEAGMGSVPNAAATADVSHPVKQGLVQSFGVFVDTFFICSSSAFIVLVTGDYATSGLTGVALVQANLATQLGDWAPYVMAIFIFMFAFSSIIGNYYYGEINISHLTKKRIYLHIFRVCVMLLVFIGSIAQLTFVWNMADLFMAFMILSNVTAIIVLEPQAFVALKDYAKQKAQGIKDPVFHKSTMANDKKITWWN